MSERVAIIGLGYVGLPVALAFARKFESTVGFDVSKARVDALRSHEDWTNEVSSEELLSVVVRELHQRCLGACVVESGFF